MFSKVLVIVASLAIAQGIELGHATSYSSISSHIQPLATLHAAPIAQISHIAPVAHIAPIAHISAYQPVQKEIYVDSHPHYSFQYGVKDTHTGDIKNQHEERDGDVVKGVYSLVQPDGTTRTVHYSADKHSGFNAQVEVTGHASHPQVVHKALVSAPVYTAYH